MAGLLEATPQEPSALDTSRLEQALGGERGIIAEILTMYEVSARSDLDGLWSALQAGSAVDVMRRAHALKGSSGNVGADAMMYLAAAIERAARADQLDDVQEQLPDLEMAFMDTLGAVRRYCAA